MRPRHEPFGGPRLIPGSLGATKSMNPLLKMVVEAPKVRTLCSKWRLERRKCEPFARNGSWSAQSTNPVPKIQGGAFKVQVEVKAICVNRWFAPNYASTALLGGLVRKVPALTFLRKVLWKRSGNASENAVWGAAGAPQRGEASRETVRTWKRHCGMRADLG